VTQGQKRVEQREQAVQNSQGYSTAIQRGSTHSANRVSERTPEGDSHQTRKVSIDRQEARGTGTTSRSQSPSSDSDSNSNDNMSEAGPADPPAPPPDRVCDRTTRLAAKLLQPPTFSGEEDHLTKESFEI